MPCLETDITDRPICGGCVTPVYITNPIEADITIDNEALAIAIADAIDAAFQNELDVLVQSGDFDITPGTVTRELVITGGVVQFPAFDAATTHVYWRHEGGSSRLAWNIDPVTGPQAGGFGHPIRNNDWAFWTKSLSEKARFVKNTGSTTYIHFSEMVRLP